MPDGVAANAQRVTRTQQIMERLGIDLLLIGPSSDFFYLTGRLMLPTERLVALIVPRRGRGTVVAPAIAAPLLSELRPALDVTALAETDSPVTHLGSLVREYGARTVAVNDDLWSGFLLDLQSQLASVRFARASSVLSEARRIKDTTELAALREAARRIDAVWEEFCATSTLTGKTELDVQRRLRDLIQTHGLEYVWCHVGAGPNSASALHEGTDRTIEPGDPVLIDYGGTYAGYFGDTCHTPVAGRAHPDFVRVYEIVRHAQEAAFQSARAGRSCEEVDQAARAVIAEQGYGDFFVHRVGHGIGISVHEDPYLIDGNQEPLESGMVFSAEPGIYIPGRWGVRIEDIIGIESGVTRRFNIVPHDLRCLP